MRWKPKKDIVRTYISGDCVNNKKKKKFLENQRKMQKVKKKSIYYRNYL